MASRRVRLSKGQYLELTQSRDWCARNDMTGLRDFYDQELAFHASRRALPLGSKEYQIEDDERAPRGPQRSRE